MFTGLLHTHSFFRWVVIVLLLVTITKAFWGWIGKKTYSSADNKLSLFTMIAVHLQLVLGIILYFISDWVRAGWSDFGAAMKEPLLRFWTIEHNLGMVIAITLITLGRMSMKKTTESISKHKKIALYFLFGAIIIFISIPWPFSSVSRPWF